MKRFERLVTALRRLPGVGPKQAERLALYAVRAPRAEVDELASALREAKAAVVECEVCRTFTERERCALCADPGRGDDVLCVVEQPADVQAIERSRAFSGRYHVLHGALSPIDGIGPDRLRIHELLDRVREGKGTLREVILATDADTEGEATAMYLTEVLRPSGVQVSRIAQGLPLGGDIDYTDELTLSMALKARRTL